MTPHPTPNAELAEDGRRDPRARDQVSTRHSFCTPPVARRKELTPSSLAARRDNDLIYLATPTPPSSLLAITPAALARPTLAPELADPLAHLRNPFFAALVPREVGEVLDLWEDRKRGWLDDKVALPAKDLDAAASLCVLSLSLSRGRPPCERLIDAGPAQQPAQGAQPSRLAPGVAAAARRPGRRPRRSRSGASRGRRRAPRDDDEGRAARRRRQHAHAPRGACAPSLPARRPRS